MKGHAGQTFVNGDHLTPLTSDWQRVEYELPMRAGERHRFVLKVDNLGGRSAWLDDFTVRLKGGAGDLEPVSRAKGKPTVVTWADGICYVNGKPTFLLGFMRGDPERLAGTPFNFCFPGELTQPDMGYLDRCAELGLLTSVNLTATTRALAPNAAAALCASTRNIPRCSVTTSAMSRTTAVHPPFRSRPCRREREVIRQIDPDHPTQNTIIPWNPAAIYRFRDAVDISGGDRYVVKGTKDNEDLWQVWQTDETFRRSALDGEPNIFIPLASHVGKITREESWAQAYMCIVGAPAASFGSSSRAPEGLERLPHAR